MDVAFWPLGTPRPHVLRAQTAMVSVVFTPDGSRLVAMGADGSVRAWPLGGSEEPNVLFSIPPGGPIQSMVIDTSGADAGLGWRRWTTPYGASR